MARTLKPFQSRISFRRQLRRPFLLAVALLAMILPVIVAAGGFEDRCADPNVVRCYGFDDLTDITNGNPRGTKPKEPTSRMYPPSGGVGNCTLQHGTACWDLDTTTKSSGASSLRFQIPSKTGADTSGSFRLNFMDDYSQRFGEGEEFYVQFRYRLSPEMIREFKNSDGFKSIIVGNGDWPGGPTQHSCTVLESVIQTDNRYLGPRWYHSCGHFVGVERWENGTCDQVRLSDIVNDSKPKYCCYGNYPNGCWQWTPDEWLTVQMNIRIGKWNKEGTSRVRVWIAREGQPSVIVYDTDVGAASTNFNGRIINDDPANIKYGKLWLLPYNTNKDDAEVHPVGYVWYDDLIISRTRIPDPGESTSDHRADASGKVEEE